jgi:ssDNA-binding replication factor A large subunit
VEGIIKDETDEVGLTVWEDKIEKLSGIKSGDEVELKDTFITSFQGSLSVNVGRDSNIEKV